MAQGSRRNARVPQGVWDACSCRDVGGARRDRETPGSGFFAVEADRQRRVALRHAAEADEPLALDLDAVTAHEQLFATLRLHERAVGALVDQHELVTVDLDARVQA